MLSDQLVHVNKNRNCILAFVVAYQVAQVQTGVFIKFVKITQKLEIDGFNSGTRVKWATWNFDLTSNRIAVTNQLDLSKHILTSYIRTGQKLKLSHTIAKAGVVEHIGATDLSHSPQYGDLPLIFAFLVHNAYKLTTAY
ncbi:Uncharacterised protein [Klebsiella pneumoniae]|nr:Uncharacterised protein [Klebsiella pneumoniae]